jgi:DNA-binding response OmpR family regulator
MMTVAIVGKHADPSVLDAALEADDCEVAVIESFDRAYSTIKRVAPQLVVLCVEVEDAAGWRVLSMLKTDVDTARIPVLTYFVTPAASDSNADAVLADTFTTNLQAAAALN